MATAIREEPLHPGILLGSDFQHRRTSLIWLAPMSLRCSNIWGHAVASRPGSARSQPQLLGKGYSVAHLAPPASPRAPPRALDSHAVRALALCK